MTTPTVKSLRPRLGLFLLAGLAMLTTRGAVFAADEGAPSRTSATESNAKPSIVPGVHRLRRAESYFGLHFDFHAGPTATEVGKRTTPAMIEAILAQVGPDYLQIDCKGHRGLSSYPTLVGNRAPGFVGDPLRTWREVTARQGVALYMHYSSLWDDAAVAAHPDWALTHADGSRDPNLLSPFSAYADALLLPQLRELAGAYGVDGVWLDAEAWAAQPDYGPASAKAFATAAPDLANTPLPRGPSDAGWTRFLEVQRERFRGYVTHTADTLHRDHPLFQVCSNWAASDRMPEPAPAGLDWLSGDLEPERAVDAARLSARYFAQQGRPWDLMSWSFVRKPAADGRTAKSAVQLKREAALVLALGGGYQAYFHQRRDGSVDEQLLPLASELARFCRERQPFCQGGKPVPQIAVLLSTADYYHRNPGLFQRSHAAVEGVLQALLDSRRAADVVSEHHLRGRLDDWPLIVVPDCEVLAEDFRAELAAYVARGGHLLLAGPGACARFTDLIGTDFGGREQTLHTVGKGLVAALHADAGTRYQQTHEAAALMQLANSAARLQPEPLAELVGPGALDLVPMRQGDRLVIHLINVSGPHRTQDLVDAIAPAAPLELRLRLPRRPSALRLMPGGTPLPFTYAEGVATATVPTVEIHAAVVVE